MEDSERQALILELNKLSEFEEQNLERMKEIAHILVQHYMGKDLESARHNTVKCDGAECRERSESQHR